MRVLIEFYEYYIEEFVCAGKTVSRLEELGPDENQLELKKMIKQSPLVIPRWHILEVLTKCTLSCFQYFVLF
jgi:hypothetical protein